MVIRNIAVLLCWMLAGFLAAGFLAATAFFTTAFLAAGFLAAGFLAAGFLAAATFFTTAFLAAGLAAGFLRPGAIIMIIWRPSSLGNCSMMMLSANSSRIRFSKAKPSSWCVISRPRNRSVILHLSPSARKRRMLRILML